MNLIGTIVTAAFGATCKGIGKAGNVPAGLPNPRMHRNGRVETDHVVPQLDAVAPPEMLNVVLELNAEGSIIPGRAKTTVDLAGLKNETPPLAQ